MKKRIKNIPFIISVMIFGVSLTGFLMLFLSMKISNDRFEDIRKIMDNSKSSKDREKEYLDYYIINGNIVQEQFRELYSRNRDIIGWIKIEGTPIDYPVMQTTTDEQYYLRRDFNKEYSYSGSIFASAKSDIHRPSDNIITYGHHMADSSMYHDIEKYEKRDYYEKHKFIRFDTLEQTGIYEVIAAFRTNIYPDDYKGFVYYRFVDATDKKEYDKFIYECKKLTPYDMDSTAVYGDQLITLSTCAYHTFQGRFVVVAKRISGVKIDTDRNPKKIINID